MVSHNTTTNVQNLVINLADLNTFKIFFMRKFVFIILLSSLICSCYNRSSPGGYNPNDVGITDGNNSITTNNDMESNDTVYDIYGISNSNTDAIVGYWTEYRTDGDAYLLGHYLFNANGTGCWILTGGLDNDTENRGTINFNWYQDESGNIVTESENGGNRNFIFQKWKYCKAIRSW